MRRRKGRAGRPERSRGGLRLTAPRPDSWHFRAPVVKQANTPGLQPGGCDGSLAGPNPVRGTFFLFPNYLLL